MKNEQTILRIDSSGKNDGSSTRGLLNALVAGLRERTGASNLIARDLADGIPHVDEEWIAANFTDKRQRTAEQSEALKLSDQLIAELKAADVVAIAVPIYNFGVPAALKAWVDMVARARVTFRYTENGPEGLLTEKKAYLVVASGGVAVDSELDFATPYMRQALRFIGITDLEVIAADQQNKRDDAILIAKQQIQQLTTGAGTVSHLVQNANQ